MRKASRKRVEVRRRALLWALGLALASLAGQAREVRVQTSGAQPPEPAGLEATGDTIELSLDQVIELAMRHNLGIVLERYGQSRFNLGIESAKGLFDLNLNGQAFYTDSTVTSRSAIEGTSSISTTDQFFAVDLSQRLPTGGNLSFGFNGSRGESDSRNAIFSPVFDTGAGFSLVQPLLRDFGVLATRRPVLLARLDSRGNREALEERITGLVQQVSNAYWALVEAQEQLRVAEEGLSLARELHERNRIQVEVGTMPPLDLVQSEANVATREEDIIRAQAAVGDAEDQLRLLLSLPPGEIWSKPIRTSTPPETEAAVVNVDQAIEIANRERPELKRQQIAIEASQLNLAFQKNQLLPRLDATLSYGGSGLGGTQLIRDPVTGQVVRTVRGDFGDALDQLLNRDTTNWRVQLDFGVPIQNRTARAQKAIAELNLDSAEVEFDRLEQQVLTEVRQAVRRVQTAEKQIEAARVSREFQEKNLDAERKRYENGMSTAFQITQIQDDVTQARSREVSAKIAYRTALTEYNRAIGQLLEAEGVVLEDPTFAESRESYLTREK